LVSSPHFPPSFSSSCPPVANISTPLPHLQPVQKGTKKEIEREIKDTHLNLKLGNI